MNIQQRYGPRSHRKKPFTFDKYFESLDTTITHLDLSSKAFIKLNEIYYDNSKENSFHSLKCLPDLNRFTHIEILNLSGNTKLCSISASHLPRTLKSINISNCNIEVIPDLKELTQLTHLDCSNNRIHSIMFDFPDLLEHLNCSQNKIATFPLKLPHNLITFDCSLNNEGRGFKYNLPDMTGNERLMTLKISYYPDRPVLCLPAQMLGKKCLINTSHCTERAPSKAGVSNNIRLSYYEETYTSKSNSLSVSPPPQVCPVVVCESMILTCETDTHQTDAIIGIELTEEEIIRQNLDALRSQMSEIEW